MSLCSGSLNEQVWTGLQWSPPDATSRGPKVWCPGGILPCDLSHDTFDVTYPTSCEQTDACENITFSQLRLRAVINSTNATLTIWIIEVAENVDENRTAAMETKNLLNPDLSEVNKCKQCTL